MKRFNANKLSERQIEIDAARNEFKRLSDLGDKLPEGEEKDKLKLQEIVAYNRSVELFNNAMKEFNLKH